MYKLPESNRIECVYDGEISYSRDLGMTIDDPETTLGKRPIGDLLGVGGYDSPHIGKRYRIVIEEVKSTRDSDVSVPRVTIGETERDTSYSADFLETRSDGPRWREDVISGPEYTGVLANAKSHRDGDVIGIRVREISSKSIVIYEEHIDGRRFDALEPPVEVVIDHWLDHHWKAVGVVRRGSSPIVLVTAREPNGSWCTGRFDLDKAAFIDVTTFGGENFRPALAEEIRIALASVL